MASSNWSRGLASLASLLPPGVLSCLHPRLFFLFLRRSPLFPPPASQTHCSTWQASPVATSLSPFGHFLAPPSLERLWLRCTSRLEYWYCSSSMKAQLTLFFSFSENLRYLGFQQRALWGRCFAPCANSCLRYLDKVKDLKAQMVEFAGARLEGPVRKLLAQQREKLHSKGEGQQVSTKHCL